MKANEVQEDICFGFIHELDLVGNGEKFIDMVGIDIGSGQRNLSTENYDTR